MANSSLKGIPKSANSNLPWSINSNNIQNTESSEENNQLNIMAMAIFA